MSRRKQIELTAAEQLHLLTSERIVIISTLGPRGWPHSMPMWFTVREGEIWVWTYAKSQKVRNLEAEAELVRDPEAVLDFGTELALRHSGDIDSIEGDAAAALRAQAAKRVAIRFRAVRTASWDHRKLGGTY